MIELKHVSKTFDAGTSGGVDALKDVSLTIEDGDIYGIIGMSGAGKSTLVRCINLLEKPTSGEIIVNGQRLDTMTPAQLRAARREITMIFQRFNLLMQRTCLRNVCFPMELAGVKRSEAEQTRSRGQRIYSRINTLSYNVTGKHCSSVQVSKGSGYSGVGNIVSRNVNGLY